MIAPISADRPTSAADAQLCGPPARASQSRTGVHAVEHLAPTGAEAGPAAGLPSAGKVFKPTGSVPKQRSDAIKPADRSRCRLSEPRAPTSFKVMFSVFLPCTAGPSSGGAKSVKADKHGRPTGWQGETGGQQTGQLIPVVYPTGIRATCERILV